MEVRRRVTFAPDVMDYSIQKASKKTFSCHYNTIDDVYRALMARLLQLGDWKNAVECMCRIADAMQLTPDIVVWLRERLNLTTDDVEWTKFHLKGLCFRLQQLHHTIVYRQCAGTTVVSTIAVRDKLLQWTTDVLVPLRYAIEGMLATF